MADDEHAGDSSHQHITQTFKKHLQELTESGVFDKGDYGHDVEDVYMADVDTTESDREGESSTKEGSPPKLAKPLFTMSDSDDSQSVNGVNEGMGDQAEKKTEESKHEDFFSNKSKKQKFSFFHYLYEELTMGYWLENDEAKFSEKRQRVYTFMKIPRELEKFMTFGFFQCVDVFLYVFTFLPLRFIAAFAKLCVRVFLSPCLERRGRYLEPAQICDLLKGIILISCTVLMNYVDVSMMYHLIRGQAIIKLYIFFNMLEVADRLFSSFGQDILDSLFWTATEPRGRRREQIGLLPHLLLAIIYVFAHAILVLFQATTLNVAFNSHNKALLTIMMSNNFVELKGSVFKKFEKNNLFQMSCSDVRERFHFIVLLSIVCVRNLTEFSWNMDHLWLLFPDVVMVMLSEFLVDWVKHAFITKFNEIPEEVYRSYMASIAYDMASSRQKNAFSDQLDVVSRRMGFIPLPIAVILLRVISGSLKITGYTSILCLIMTYLCLTTFKIANMIVLLGVACDYVEENKAKKVASQTTIPSKKSSTDMPGGYEIKRSKSVGSFDVENVTLVDKSDKLERSSSLSAKPLFSNSNVNLPSVGLNEDFIKDSQSDTKVNFTQMEDVRQRTSAKQQKPLSEIDRYTMCSNRII